MAGKFSFKRFRKRKGHDSELERIRKGTDFYPLFGSVLVFLLLIVVLIAYQNSVSYETREFSLQYLDTEPSDQKTIDQQASTLLVWQQDDEESEKGLSVMSDVLSQMKEPYEICETAGFSRKDPDDYQRIIIAVTSCGKIADSIPALKQWVYEGGSLMFLYMPEADGVFLSLSDMLGIKDCAGTNTLVESLHFVKDLMPGGTEKDFTVDDAYKSSLSISLKDSCEVYLESGAEYPVPIIWSNIYGQGKVVADNLGFLEKAYRGFHCAAYSLLSDACLYPVINASTFFIDDFPSPVPGGNGTYITRDYGLSISEFYTQKWWPDIYNLAQKYGIRYTGLVIENYSDQTSGTFARNTETSRYSYFGNMLLQMGGEIGIHGYNHMPLVLENFDYEGLYDSYVQWKSRQAMEDGFIEVMNFTKLLFPDIQIQTYVPPSNILSDEGRQMLAETFPEIRSVAAVYFPGELAFAQEFNVSEDGIVNTPRVISGYIMDDFTQGAAFSELTFHYVNTHFQHPDDVLDEDRGAEMGWETLFGNLSSYAEWLYSSAPSIRNLTGSELGAAVQRYDYIQVERTENAEGMSVHLENFYDEAWFLLRLNCSDEVPAADGAVLTEVSENLYLVEADSADIQIYYERQD